jgi:hypothetical protein
MGSGGGLPLPDLFSAILNELLDHGSPSDERMIEITSSVLSFKTEQVFHTWPTWQALTDDVLAQMESRGLIRRENGFWVRGSNLVTGQMLEIIPARKSKGSKPDGVIVWPKDERNARSKAAHNVAEIAALAGSLRPDNPGLRPVDKKRAQQIHQTVPEMGYLYPVVVDQYGRILDGKHRKVADPDWPVKEVQVDSDEMALAIALWANSGKELPAKVRDTIEAVVLEEKTAREKRHEKITASLLENPQLSHYTIAKQLGGIQPQEITKACRSLISQGEISECQHQLTENGKLAAAPKSTVHTATEIQVEKLLLENPRQSDAQIRRAVGLSNNQHRVVERVRVRLESEGIIPIVTARKGSDGTLRRVRHNAIPSPSIATQRFQRARQSATANTSAGKAWSNIVDRISQMVIRWRNEPLDAASELGELEALRQEIDDRIAALRGEPQ